MFRFFESKEAGKNAVGTGPCQSNVDNLNSVRCEVSRHFRNKRKEYLRAKIEELEANTRLTTLGICIGASMTLRRGTRLDKI